jgi:hypothetical protein
VMHRYGNIMLLIPLPCIFITTANIHLHKLFWVVILLWSHAEFDVR